MTDDIQPQNPPPDGPLPPLPPRLGVHDIRNSDLVSRYMAATPPYLYSSPVGPHNFFFSDMLRSIVQSRNNEQAARSANNTTSTTTPHVRRSRKRAWGQARTIYDPTINKDSKLQPLTSSPGKAHPDKPLELTNKCHSPTLKSSMDKIHPDALKGLPQKHSHVDYAQLAPHNNNNIPAEPTSLPPTTTTPPSDLVLPPPPPMWYPPLYPPYGIDPLHFFIDLRVSGHIYDRKKENTSPNTGPSALNPTLDAAGKQRQGSAFSVPPSRRDQSPNARALNLTATSPTGPADKHSPFTQTYINHSPENKDLSAAKNNANYVLQNLPRIYTDLTTHMAGAGEERNSVNSDETTDSKSELDAQEAAGMMGAIEEPDAGERFELGDRDDDSNDVVIVDSKF